VLREYLESMRALWAQEHAEYAGEFVRFGPSWAWPKPTRGVVPAIIGAAGTDNTFNWVARHADGWLTTPRDEGIVPKVARLQEIWTAAGRAGRPRVIALDGRPDGERLAEWAAGGVTDVVYGLPDRAAQEIPGYLDRLVGKLEVMQPGSLVAA
jgi:alkanesulfonate monooxygenase SsuD/methylene tetrahydromethanopterin reductase-like flavin-dependent oxidoreductase (luciferase family)